MSEQDIAATARFFATLRVGGTSSSRLVTDRHDSKRQRSNDTETVEMKDAETARKRKGARRQRRKETQVPAPPVAPVVIQVSKKHRSIVNHSYKDYSRVPATSDYTGEPTELAEMSFLQKLHHMLAQDKYALWISWMPHGRAFRTIVPKRLEQTGTFREYFGYSRYGAFATQLNNFGFKHISQDKDRNCYYHELMLRGMPHLSKYMPAPKDARRLHPDPENEPDFYKIQEELPLPSNATSPQENTTDR